MNVLQPLGAVGVVIAALALAACDDGAGDGQADAALPPPPVTVANPLVMPVTEWYEFTGRFEATESVEVRARVSGYLEEIGFEDGEIVEQGQVLFVIDRRPYQAEVERCRRRLASAEAQVDLADAELSASPSSSSTTRTSRARPTISACRKSVPPRRRRRWRQAAVRAGRARPRVHRGARADQRADLRSPGRHRQPGDRRPGGDPAHHDRGARARSTSCST